MLHFKREELQGTEKQTGAPWSLFLIWICGSTLKMSTIYRKPRNRHRQISVLTNSSWETNIMGPKCIS